MRKLLSLALALLMVCVILPVTALAADDTVSSETELKNAINSAASGDAITLSNSINLSEKLVLPENKTFTLNLGTYNITQTAEGVNAINLSAGDNVTITGSGTITGNYNGIYVPSGATLTVNGGEIKATYNGIYNEGTTTMITGTVYGLYIGSGNVTIEGGNVEKNSDGDSFPANGGSLTVKDGTIEGWMSPDLSTTVSGGTFNHTVFANQVTGGTFNGALNMAGSVPSVSNATINGKFSWSSTVPAIGSGVKFGENATLDQKNGAVTEGYAFNSERNNIVEPIRFQVIKPDAAEGSYELTYFIDNNRKTTRTGSKVDDKKVPVGSELKIEATVQATSGYKFDGWYLNGVKLTEGVDENGTLNTTLTITENTTLTARFVSRDLDNKATEFFKGYSAKNSFTISSTDEMELFAYAVTNLGYDFSGKTVTLANDLDYTGKTYRVVGDWDHPFKGTFDGGNNTIKKITVAADDGYVGLFANLSGATVQNLNLSDCTFSASTTGWVGGIAAEAGGNTIIKNCTISNVSTSGWFSGSVIGHTYGGVTVDTVTVTGCTASGSKAGMIAGYSDSMTIKDVTVSDVKAGAALIGHANAGANVIENAKVDAPNAALIGMTYGEHKGTVTIKGEDTQLNAKAVTGEDLADSKTLTIEAGKVTGDIAQDIKDNAEKYLPENKHVGADGTITNKPSTPSTIVIISPSEDKPNEDISNPSTGANDMVAAAMALMAVSALGAVALLRKK